MFLLATRDRPHLMAELIEAMQRLGDVPPVAVMHDGCERYAVDYPAHWSIHQSDEHLEMSAAIHRLFLAHPGRPWYGYLNDHCFPMMPGWHDVLIGAAGQWRIASAWDTKNRWRTSPTGRKKRINCYVLGGELARTLGWIWPPFVIHLFGDDCLEAIGDALHLMTHERGAVMDNRTLRDGRLPRDGNSRRLYKGIPYLEHDAMAAMQWKRHELPKIVAKLRQLIPADALENA